MFSLSLQHAELADADRFAFSPLSIYLIYLSNPKFEFFVVPAHEAD